MQATAEVSCVSEALELIRNKHFDVILLDLSLPKQSAMELLQAVKAKTFSPLVLVVSACDEDQWAVQVFKGGADRFIKKNMQEYY